VIEVRESYDGDAYRAVYTVRYADAVYVLHAFQKKSKKGISTPRAEIDLIEKRAMTQTPAARDPTRNVWLHLGLPDAEEHFLKAKLVLRLGITVTVLDCTP